MAEDRPPSDDASRAAFQARMPRRALLGGGLAMLAGCGEPIRPVPPAADGPPRRIVSLNPCLDVILIRWSSTSGSPRSATIPARP
ncbi:MAG: hypothetical protein K2X61_15470, partial [Caulobacteraceae bacterium]|nr:hypothetical protein [Caulobacteraceae bacterium]